MGNMCCRRVVYSPNGADVEQGRCQQVAPQQQAEVHPIQKSPPMSIPFHSAGDECAINELLEGRMDLDVILPDGRQVRLTVERRTPMMDLLVQAASATKISPAGHTIHVFTDDSKGTTLHYKPSTPIGSLDANVICIVPKKDSTLDSGGRRTGGKVAPRPFEATFRVQVRLPRNQLTVARVSPRVRIRELRDMVCREKGLDSGRYQLVRPTDPSTPLDGESTLAEYGSTEITLLSNSCIESHLCNSTSHLMSYTKRNEEQKRKTGILRLIAEDTTQKEKQKLQTVSHHRPAPTIRVTEAPHPGKYKPKKRRPAPPPPPPPLPEPPFHSRQSSSDSSGYHEATSSYLHDEHCLAIQDEKASSDSSGVSSLDAKDSPSSSDAAPTTPPLQQQTIVGRKRKAPLPPVNLGSEQNQDGGIKASAEQLNGEKQVFPENGEEKSGSLPVDDELPISEPVVKQSEPPIPPEPCLPKSTTENKIYKASELPNIVEQVKESKIPQGEAVSRVALVTLSARIEQDVTQQEITSSIQAAFQSVDTPPKIVPSLLAIKQRTPAPLQNPEHLRNCHPQVEDHQPQKSEKTDCSPAVHNPQESPQTDKSHLKKLQLQPQKVNGYIPEQHKHQELSQKGKTPLKQLQPHKEDTSPRKEHQQYNHQPHKSEKNSDLNGKELKSQELPQKDKPLPKKHQPHKENTALTKEYQPTKIFQTDGHLREHHLIPLKENNPVHGPQFRISAQKDICQQLLKQDTLRASDVPLPIEPSPSVKKSPATDGALPSPYPLQKSSAKFNLQLKDDAVDDCLETFLPPPSEFVDKEALVIEAPPETTPKSSACKSLRRSSSLLNLVETPGGAIPSKHKKSSRTLQRSLSDLRAEDKAEFEAEQDRLQKEYIKLQRQFLLWQKQLLDNHAMLREECIVPQYARTLRQSHSLPEGEDYADELPVGPCPLVSRSLSYEPTKDRCSTLPRSAINIPPLEFGTISITNGSSTLRSSKTKSYFKPPQIRVSTKNRQRLPPEIRKDGDLDLFDDTKILSTILPTFESLKLISEADDVEVSTHRRFKEDATTIPVSEIVKKVPPAVPNKTTTLYKSNSVVSKSINGHINGGSCVNSARSVAEKNVGHSENGIPPPPPPMPSLEKVKSSNQVANVEKGVAKKIVDCQSDPRELLMNEIRKFGGRTALRKISLDMPS